MDDYPVKREEIFTSDMATNRLAALALTLPVASNRNELFGRSHAFYAIAHTQADAIMFVLDSCTADVERRTVAARALALAGHTLAHLRTLG